MALATFHFSSPVQSVTFNGRTASSSPASISYSATASISKITVSSNWSGTVYWDTTSAMSDPYVLATVSNGSVTMKTANLTYTGSNRDVYLSASGSSASYTLSAGVFPNVLSAVYFSDGYSSLTSSSRSCTFSSTKYIRSISLTSAGSNWCGTIYWSSSSGGTTYPIADVSYGTVTMRSSIEQIDFYNSSRTIYFTAVEDSTYSTNFINLRCGDGINSFTAEYENMYGKTVRETVSGTGTTTKAVRAGTNLKVIVTSTATGYDEPYYIVEYTSSSYSTEKTTFAEGDMYVYSNGTRYVKVFASQQKRYRIRVQSGATDATFSDGATERYIPTSGYMNNGTSSTVSYSLSNLPTPTRSGYVLQGWLYNSVLYDTSDLVNLTASTSGYTNVITASWKKRLTFTIYANGGVYQDDRSSYRTTPVFVGNTFSFTSWSGLMTRDGYKLLGWSTSSTATSPTWGTSDSFTVKDDSPLAYYAVWQQTKARITFYGNGGLWGGNLQSRYKDFNVGDTVSFADYSENLTRAGYSLLGWSASSTATTATYGVNGYVTVGATDADYYAVWSKHIDLFYWYGSDTQDAAKIAKGQPVSNLTATIWNSFKKKISEVKIAQTGSDWGYLTVSSGDGIAASEVLAARNALAALNNNVPLPTANQLKTGEQILASYFNGTGSLKAALNIIINNYNNS